MPGSQPAAALDRQCLCCNSELHQPSVCISSNLQFQTVIVHSALPAQHCAHYPHGPEAGVSVETHGITCGPATAPTLPTNSEVRCTRGRVDRCQVARSVAGGNNAQLLFHNVEGGSTGEDQRPL